MRERERERERERGRERGRGRERPLRFNIDASHARTRICAGIVQPLAGARPSPPGLTDCSYLLQYLRHRKRQNPDLKLSIIGMSAGSMLAIAVAAEAEPGLLASVVAACGPDQIRCVFEHHRRYTVCRLDIYFTLLLWSIMKAAGCAPHLAPALGCPWFGGWLAMRRLTEACFEKP
eukprot:SAG22_NODE_1198_length_5193_cov_12.289360_2_plen_176_part_00